MKTLTLTDEQNELLSAQVRSEYTPAETHLLSKLEDWRKWLKLYCNKRKNPRAIGDNTLFAIHQTFLAAVFNDRMDAEFLPREYGDKETAERLNMLAEYDYDEMSKAEIDYDWIWNASFFGRSIVELSYFDAEKKRPVPKAWDTVNTFVDPYASSINGKTSNGDGAARFFGRMIGKTMRQMEKEGFQNTEDIGGWSPDSEITQTKQARDEARGLTYQKDTIEGESKLYNVLEWFTYHDGKKVKVYAGQAEKDNKKNTVILKVIDLEDEEWPVIDRAIYPVPGEWYGISIPMLVEDKQRALAKLKNITLDGVESSAYNRFAYNADKIKTKRDLEIGANRHIAIDGPTDGAIIPLPKPTVAPGLDFMLSILDRDAQTASATPDIKQGVAAAGSETLGELKLIGAASANRYGLSVKLFGLSERRFWRQWYWLYKKNFKDIGSKSVRLNGTYGVEFRAYTAQNLKFKVDPDVKVRSRGIKKQKDRDKLTVLTSLSNVVMADETVNKREFLKETLSAAGMTTDGINRIMPPTPDELDAESENKQLNENKNQKARMDENHEQHILIHRRAAETPAKRAHIEAHKEMLKDKNKTKQKNTERLEAQGKVDNNRARAPLAQFNNLPQNGIATEV